MPAATNHTLTADELAAAAAAEIDVDYIPDRKPHEAEKLGTWEPELNHTQKLMFHDPSPFILAYGEKGSGKTTGALHKLIRHCYEEWDALGVIVTPSIRTGKFGAVADLETLVLPSWTDGISLDWLPSRLDPQTKDRVLKIGNVHGGWSTILQISIPYEEAIAARIKGIHPSCILAEEATDMQGRGYFTTLTAQMYRRRHIRGPQQYMATCNPTDEESWVYQVFIEEPTNKETGERDSKFAVYHVPFHENSHRPEMRGYIENLERAVRNDPIERARLIEGKWISRPTGDALFANHYLPDRHRIGDVDLGTGLRPVTGLPCYIGYDLGQRYSAAVFLQPIPTNSGEIWIIFDEVVHLREKITYKLMASEVVERVLEWNKLLGKKLPWLHVTDDSALNQWRPGGAGSLDAWEFEQEFRKAGMTHGLHEMRMRGCPKGAGSVATRVRLVQGLLIADQLLISASCEHVHACLMHIRAGKDDELKPKKVAAGYDHVLDSFSYAMLSHVMRGAASFDAGALPVIGLMRVGA